MPICSHSTPVLVIYMFITIILYIYYNTIISYNRTALSANPTYLFYSDTQASVQQSAISKSSPQSPSHRVLLSFDQLQFFIRPRRRENSDFSNSIFHWSALCSSPIVVLPVFVCGKQYTAPITPSAWRQWRKSWGNPDRFECQRSP